MSSKSILASGPTERSGSKEPLPASRVSLKQAAWSFGCAKKGSEEERVLLERFWLVVERERPAHRAPVLPKPPPSSAPVSAVGVVIQQSPARRTWSTDRRGGGPR